MKRNHKRRAALQGQRRRQRRRRTALLGLDIPLADRALPPWLLAAHLPDPVPTAWLPLIGWQPRPAAAPPPLAAAV